MKKKEKEKEKNKKINKINAYDNPNFNLDFHHPVIKDILWSIGVQHSPAGVDEIIRNTFNRNINSRFKKDTSRQKLCSIRLKNRSK